MAARRLVIVMLVLLAVSTLAAALVPAPESDQGAEETTGRGSAPPRGGPADGSAPAVPGRRAVVSRIRISNRRPPTIALRPGDQLTLQVSASFGDDVTIPAFGLTETMTPLAPASFDLIVDRAGTFAVRTVETVRLVGRIKATTPKPKPPPKRSPARD
jgi:hypothetical protein